MTCPACGCANHATAPFCLECGATLSLNNDEGGSFAPAAATPVAPVGGKSRPSLPVLLSPLRWSMELRLVAALLLLLVGFQFMVSQGVAADTAAYDAARAAMVHQQWHAAVKQLAPLAAGGFRDASVQLDAAKKQVAAFDVVWQAGLQASVAGDGWQALQSFDAAAAIEPTYSGLDSQLTSIHAALGKMVYRLPASSGSHTALWLADVDGGNAVQLPATDANTHIFAVDGDGDGLLYGNLIAENLLSDRPSLDFHLYDTTHHTDHSFSIPISGTALFSRNDLIASYQAAFFAGGAVVSEGGFGDRSDTAGGFRCWAFDNAGNMREFHAALIARPSPTDATIYFVDGNNQQPDTILGYNHDSTSDQVQQVLGKTVTHLYVVNQQLLYSTYNQDETAIYMADVPMRSSRTVLALPNSQVGVIYGSLSLYIMPAPNGHAAFITVPNGEHYLLNLDSGLLFGLSGLPAGGHCSVRFASFSPDGQHLLLGGVIFYSALSPSSEGPRYDWIGVSDLSGKIGAVARFTGSIDGGGFLSPDTVYYYRSSGNGGLDNYSEVVVSAVNALSDDAPALPNLNLQAAGNWLPYSLSLVDRHTLLFAGSVGSTVGVYALAAPVVNNAPLAARMPANSSAPAPAFVPLNNTGVYIIGTDNIGSSGMIHRLAANATSVWLLKSGQISPAGLP